MKATLLLLLLLPAAAFAQGPQTEAAPDPIQVILVSGDTLQARCIQPASFDMFEVTIPGSETRFVPGVRIRTVLDADHRDRTEDLLSRRRTIGTPLPEPVRREAKHGLRVGPRSVTPGFLITETSLLGRVDPGPPAELRHYLAFDLGYMSNVGSQAAVGWSAFFGSATRYVNAGVRVRLRRWISPTSSVDIAPGVIITEHRSEYGTASPPGFSVQASVSPSRYVTLAVEGYTLARHDYTAGDVRENGVLAGVKIGQWPGAAGAFFATLAALLEGGDYASPMVRTNP
jgi:hypothetical protein